MAATTDKSAEAAKSEAPVRVRLRYLGDKQITHSMTGKVFTKFVMHKLSAEEAQDLLHWTRGEEFEEIR